MNETISNIVCSFFVSFFHISNFAKIRTAIIKMLEVNNIRDRETILKVCDLLVDREVLVFSIMRNMGYFWNIYNNEWMYSEVVRRYKLDYNVYYDRIGRVINVNYFWYDVHGKIHSTFLVYSANSEVVYNAIMYYEETGIILIETNGVLVTEDLTVTNIVKMEIN